MRSGDCLGQHISGIHRCWKGADDERVTKDTPNGCVHHLLSLLVDVQAGPVVSLHSRWQAVRVGASAAGADGKLQLLTIETPHSYAPNSMPMACMEKLSEPLISIAQNPAFRQLRAEEPLLESNASIGSKYLRLGSILF